VIIDGFTFQHGASPFQGSGLSVNDSRNVRLANVTSRFNNVGGIGMWNVVNVTWRNVASIDNGFGGGGLGKCRLIRFDGVETSRNDWKGAPLGLTGWAFAGFKALFIHDMWLTGFLAEGNQTRGFWLDTDIARVLCEDLVSNENHQGTFLEAIQGPLVLQRTAFLDNDGDGIHTGNLTQFALLDSAVSGNEDTVLFMSGDDTRAVTDFETGQQYAVVRGEDWTLRGNAFRGGQRLFGAHSRPAFDHMAASLDSDENTWIHPAPAPYLIGGGQTTDFAGWQAATGQDVNSTFTPA
jgi:hypothetical protein